MNGEAIAVDRRFAAAPLASVRRAVFVALVFATACGTAESEPEPQPECQLLEPESEIVTEEFVESADLPQGSGGQLLDGTYDLVRRLHHIPVGQPPNPPNQMRATLRVRGARAFFDYAFVEDTVITPALSATKFSARIEQDASTLVLSHTCPDATKTELSYTAGPDLVTLIERRDEFFFRRR